MYQSRWNLSQKGSVLMAAWSKPKNGRQIKTTGFDLQSRIEKNWYLIESIGDFNQGDGENMKRVKNQSRPGRSIKSDGGYFEGGCKGLGRVTELTEVNGRLYGQLRDQKTEETEARVQSFLELWLAKLTNSSFVGRRDNGEIVLAKNSNVS